MYTFDEAKHLHMLDGKALTGTTTVLQVIAKPALLPWAVKTCADYMIAFLPSVTKGEFVMGTPKQFLEAIDESKKQHRMKKEAAGDWGTTLHLWVENYALASIAGNAARASVPLEGTMGDACRHFMDWSHKNSVKFLESEKNVYSREMWVGGICDLVVEIDGKVWLADVKTGSGIYPEHFWQMASYQMCLQDMGLYPEVAGYIVLNLKKDGTFEEKRSISNEENQSAFKAALTIYRIQEKIKSKVIA